MQSHGKYLAEVGRIVSVLANRVDALDATETGDVPKLQSEVTFLRREVYSLKQTHQQMVDATALPAVAPRKKGDKRKKRADTGKLETVDVPAKKRPKPQPKEKNDKQEREAKENEPKVSLPLPLPTVPPPSVVDDGGGEWDSPLEWHNRERSKVKPPARLLDMVPHTYVLWPKKRSQPPCYHERWIEVEQRSLLCLIS